MDLSSSLTGTKEFRIVKRGYDPDEVDAFLDQIALGVAELKRKSAEATDRAEAAAAGTPGVGANATATAEAEEIHRALILAQRAADEEVRKAAAEGEAVVAEARDRAAEVLREADREVAERREQGRAALQEEIADLEGRRDALTADVSVLERHVDEQREVVQAALGELQSLLDHPEAFRVAPATQVTGRDPGGMAEPLPPGRAPAPPHATADADGDDDEEGDSPAEPDIDLSAPLPGREDLSRALRFDPAEEAGPGAPVISAPVVTDPGPPTQALDPIAAEEAEERGSDDDAFLAELRKAMLDDEPLGPRDIPVARVEDPPARPSRARFGRRR